MLVNWNLALVLQELCRLITAVGVITRQDGKLTVVLSAMAGRLEDQGGLLARGDICAGPEVGQDKRVGGHFRQK